MTNCFRRSIFAVHSFGLLANCPSGGSSFVETVTHAARGQYLRQGLAAIAHRLCRLIWKILHDGISYIKQGAEPTPQAKKLRAKKLTQALRKLGYQVTLAPITPAQTGVTLG